MDEVETMKTVMWNKYLRYFLDLRNMDNLYLTYSESSVTNLRLQNRLKEKDLKINKSITKNRGERRSIMLS